MWETVHISVHHDSPYEHVQYNVSGPLLKTFVFNKCLEKKLFTIICVVKSLKGFGWNNVSPASQTVAQHYISIGPMYRVIWCFWRRERHQYNAAVGKHGTITHCCFNDGPASKTVSQH